MVEFAVIAIPFFTLIIGIIEVGLIFWAGYELENATAAAARLVRTGQAQTSESVHEVHEGLQSRLSIMRMEASLTKVSAVRVRFSKSFARRRQRLSQANVRSTIQRLGRTSKPLA